MSTSAALLIVSCNEGDPRIDPSRFFSLSATTTVIRTAGGRTADAIAAIYHTDAADRLGMIIVIHHSECTQTAGNIDTNVRSDIATLQASPHVRNDIPIIGYALDTASGQLREINNVQSSGKNEEARRRVLSQMDDFGPFWN